MDVLSFPFQPDPTRYGRMKLVEYGSDEYKAQQIAVFLRTNKTERRVMPQFGIDDPTFDRFDANAFSSGFAHFYNNIKLDKIEVTTSGNAVTEVNVSFV